MVLSFFATVAVYFASIILFPDYIDVDAITNDFLFKIGVIVTISWLPLHIIRCIANRYSPSDYQKVMQSI